MAIARNIPTPKTLILLSALFGGISLLWSCASLKPHAAPQVEARRPGAGQVPSWSAEDMETFLHGTVGTEVIPERVLSAFMSTYPDLYPGGTLLAFGLLSDGPGRLPVGVSRRTVDHLGGQSAIGINCASCHTGELSAGPGAPAVRVLGMTSHFDVEAFFGAMTIATFRSAEPDNLRRYLSAYLAASDPSAGEAGRKLLEEEWQRQSAKIAAAIAEDPSGANGAPEGGLQVLTAQDLRLDGGSLKLGQDLPAVARAHLKLFHNMRSALHIPDEPPKELPPLSGPGRNNAFGLLALSLLHVQPVHAPVKYGLVWNVSERGWVHWDGNTSSPLIRNLAGALGLGAPLIGKRGVVDMAVAEHQTALTERILAPSYPFAIDAKAAARGAEHFKTRCASCHAGPEDDRRLHPVSEVGTDDQRLKLFNADLAERFNRFFDELEIPGYYPPKTPTIRSTGKYWAADLRGAWARSPYLHNGSVRTMRDLLIPAASRSRSFRRGSRIYDAAAMGYQDEGYYPLKADSLGNSNSGHEYGTDLAEDQKRDLIEYLKTL